MKIRLIFLLLAFCLSHYIINAVEKVSLIHNFLKDIDACKEKLQLKLVRVWGGDEEEDENKFFKTPNSLIVDNSKAVYICDWHNHCIKVFDSSGKYMRTIGRRGQGPGDLYAPTLIKFSPGGDLLVYESGGRRFQWFDINGKSKRILKYSSGAVWFGINSKSEIALYDLEKTFMKRILITLMDKNGKVIKEFGQYHDKSKGFMSAEQLNFCMDKSDNIYAAYKGTPLIMKFSPDGSMRRAITFETPFDIPVEVTLNSNGDGIEIKKESSLEEVKYKATRMGDGVAIQQTGSNDNEELKYGICIAITADENENIYIVTIKRKMTEKEKSGAAISGGDSGMNRSLVDFDKVKNIDINRLLVFNPNGKILAEAPLTTFCDGLYVHGNRIFIIDGILNQRILEYEMTFEE